MSQVVRPSHQSCHWTHTCTRQALPLPWTTKKKKRRGTTLRLRRCPFAFRALDAWLSPPAPGSPPHPYTDHLWIQQLGPSHWNQSWWQTDTYGFGFHFASIHSSSPHSPLLSASSPATTEATGHAGVQKWSLTILVREIGQCKVRWYVRRCGLKVFRSFWSWKQTKKKSLGKTHQHSRP